MNTNNQANKKRKLWFLFSKINSLLKSWLYGVIKSTQRITWLKKNEIIKTLFIIVFIILFLVALAYLVWFITSPFTT